MANICTRCWLLELLILSILLYVNSSGLLLVVQLLSSIFVSEREHVSSRIQVDVFLSSSSNERHAVVLPYSW